MVKVKSAEQGARCQYVAYLLAILPWGPRLSLVSHLRYLISDASSHLPSRMSHRRPQQRTRHDQTKERKNCAFPIVCRARSTFIPARRRLCRVILLRSSRAASSHRFISIFFLVIGKRAPNRRAASSLRPIPPLLRMPTYTQPTKAVGSRSSVCWVGYEWTDDAVLKRHANGIVYQLA